MNYPLSCVAAATIAVFCLPAIAQSSASKALELQPNVQRALALLKGNANLMRLADQDKLEAFAVVTDADGSAHVRFDRRYKGLRVIGGDMVVHMTPRKTLKQLSRTLLRNLDLDVAPSLDAERARAFAAAQFEGTSEGEAQSELVIYARDSKPVLAWDVSVRGTRSEGMPSDMHLIVSAHGETLLDQWDEIQTATALGSGTGFYSGTIALQGEQMPDGSYQLADTTRGGQLVTDMKNKGNMFTGGPRGTVMVDTTNVWGSGTAADRTTVGVDAAYGAAQTWDYYLKTFGRSGIKNDGKGAESRTHWGKKIANAAWDDKCFCMMYGDGGGSYGPLVSLDVAGHEMTHGVTSATAKLIYSKESGGLNESMSDVFGTMVEYFANNPNDRPDYKIGERFVKDQTTGAAFRFMYFPSSNGSDPSAQSADCWYPAVGNLDVHYSSGVGNHVYYLLAEGSNPVGGPASPTCKAGDQKVATGNAVLKGIGRDAAQKIWYRALTTYLTSSATYATARSATISAATDLFGATSANTNAVKAAWTAVNVN